MAATVPQHAKPDIPGMVIDWIGGNCPVQAEGTIHGVPFYFRARGSCWSLTVDRTGDFFSSPDAWRHEQYYAPWPAAGWMDEEEAIAFLASALRRYTAGLPGSTVDDRHDERELRRIMALLSRTRRLTRRRRALASKLASGSRPQRRTEKRKASM